MAERVPQFAGDADFDNPREFIAWALWDWPAVEKSQAYPPAPAPLLPYHSERLWRLGFRFHPELAEIKKVRTEDNKIAYIPVDQPDPVTSEAVRAEEDLASILRQVDPAMVEQIQNMSPEEREADLKNRKKLFDEALDVLKRIGDGQTEG